ncbi:unnamed protein product, partial [Tetraodon nigroviridis]
MERCDLNIKTNNTDHRTDRYGDKRLVVRRGQPFTLFFLLKPGSTALKPSETSFTVQTGPLPQKKSNTKVSFGLSGSTPDTEWRASATDGPSEKTVCVSITSAPTAPVGLYALSVKLEGQKTKLGEFVLLFNAWCLRDAVYMRSETKRQEYVLSQHGQIFRGTSKRIKGTPWSYGQFDPDILDICLKILDANPKFVSDADQDCSARRDPVYVTRVLSAMVGPRVGGRYRGAPQNLLLMLTCLRPSWRREEAPGSALCSLLADQQQRRHGRAGGAVERLHRRRPPGQLDRQRGHPAAVGRERARLLRPVLGLRRGRLHRNFHVWVESWMTRPDLGPDFDGWQTSDPTPQETSEGVYCCGPAPVRAIKEGELTVKYDAPFIFAEVNADVVDLVRLKDGKTVRIGGSTKSVGQFISTKAVGSDERHDITHQYKYPEGSEEERQVYEKAQHHNKLQKRGEEPGLRLKIKLVDSVVVGWDFEVFAVLTNNCMEARTCSFLFFARTVSYNGKLGDTCGVISEKVEVPPGGGQHTNPPSAAGTRLTRLCSVPVSPPEKRLSLRLEYQSYGSKLTSDRLIQLSAVAMDKNSMDFQKAEKNIVLDDPDIQIKLVGEARAKGLLTAELTLVNSLPEVLKDCSFTLEGVGLTEGGALTHSIGDVGPGQEARASVQLCPSRAGATVLLVNFHSDKLTNVRSFINVVIG